MIWQILGVKSRNTSIAKTLAKSGSRFGEICSKWGYFGGVWAESIGTM